MTGFDYGIKPSIVVLGDMQFHELLQSGLQALGYGELPQFGVQIDAPFVAFAFSGEEIAQESFKRLRDWIEGSDGDEDAGL